jgi:NTP pyrophosphatase (non-canonical NTP hydrolase)
MGGVNSYLTQAWLQLTQRKTASAASAEQLQLALANETADLLGHVLLFAHQHDLDLAAAVSRKWRFDPNTPRPDE